MKHPIHRTFTLALALTAGAFVQAQDAATSPIETAVKDAIAENAPVAPIEDFDAAWTLIRDTHFDPTLNGVDWEAIRAELRPAALEANKAEVRGIILEMLSRLGQSHFTILPKTGGGVVSYDHAGDQSGDADGEPEIIEVPTPLEPTLELARAESERESGMATPGLETRLVGDNVTVVHVTPGSDAEAQGVQPGWRLLAIGTQPLAPIVVEQVSSLGRRTGGMYLGQIISATLMGAEGSHTRLVFQDAEGAELALELQREKLSEPPVEFAGLPPMSPNFEHRWLAAGEFGLEGDARIGYISFDVWLQTIPRQFDAAMLEFADADGLVLDLRGNLGGIGAIAMTIGRYLVDEPASLGTMRMRNQELSFNLQPVMVSMMGEDLDPFDGPVAVLIDGGSASTSEIFAAGIRELGRARLFGEPTPGMALPAMLSELPSGDVLLHAMAGFETPNGVNIEHAGVVPDEMTPWDRDVLLQGRDPALHAATNWIVNGEQ